MKGTPGGVTIVLDPRRLGPKLENILTDIHDLVHLDQDAKFGPYTSEKEKDSREVEAYGVEAGFQRRLRKLFPQMFSDEVWDWEALENLRGWVKNGGFRIPV